MSNSRLPILHSIKHVILAMPSKAQIIDQYLKTNSGKGLNKLDTILDMIKKNQKIKIRGVFDIKQNYDDVKNQVDKPNNFICHKEVSPIFALFNSKKYKHLLQPNTDHVYSALKKLKDEKEEITFAKVIIQSLLICLSKHQIFIDVEDFIKRKEIEETIQYVSDIDPNTIKNYFKMEEKQGNIEDENAFEANLALYKSKRENPKDSLAAWIKDPNEVFKQFEKRANDKQIFGFLNYFNGYTKLALMVDFLVQEISCGKTDNKIETVDLTDMIDKIFIKKMKVRSKNQIEAVSNGKFKRMFEGDSENVNSINKAFIFQPTRSPDIFYYSPDDNAIKFNQYVAFNSEIDASQLGLPTATEAKLDDAEEYRSVSTDLENCSNDFMKLLLLRYLTDLNVKKQTIMDDNKKKIKKFKEGFEHWLKTKEIKFFEKKE